MHAAGRRLQQHVWSRIRRRSSNGSDDFTWSCSLWVRGTDELDWDCATEARVAGAGEVAGCTAGREDVATRCGWCRCRPRSVAGVRLRGARCEVRGKEQINCRSGGDREREASRRRPRAAVGEASTRREGPNYAGEARPKEARVWVRVRVWVWVWEQLQVPVRVLLGAPAYSPGEARSEGGQWRLGYDGWRS